MDDCGYDRGIMPYNRYDGPGNTYFPNEEEATALKLEFAEALLRFPDEPFEAARRVFGEDHARVSYVASAWVRDPVVLAEQERLIEEFGPEEFLPSKAEYARVVWRNANNPSIPVEDRVKLLNMYGDIRGFKEKPGVVINNNTNTLVQNRVMLVKDHGGAEAWEKLAAKQQHQLISSKRQVSDAVEVKAG